MTSLWLDRPLDHGSDPLPDDRSFDDVVVGAVTTGRTTAKASLLQGIKLSGLLTAHTRGGADGLRGGQP